MDVADTLCGWDVVIEKTDKYRTYNLLQRASFFKDNDSIGLDILSMVMMDFSESHIEQQVFDYLSQFLVFPDAVDIANIKGTLGISMRFQNG